MLIEVGVKVQKTPGWWVVEADVTGKNTKRSSVCSDKEWHKKQLVI